jgi:Ca2+-binding RTX toxin-like protein
VPYAKAAWQAQADVAEQYGMTLSAYEGGQHVHHLFAVGGISEQDVLILTEFMTDYVRSDDMAMLYQQAWEAWSEVTDSPFMQFGDVELPSKWGSWGLYSSLDDDNPRAMLLTALNEANSPAGGAPTEAQQGVILYGDAAANEIVGTLQEDYLIGKAGDDTFFAGRGNDGIAGGAGFDVLVLSGRPADYTVTREGQGYRVIGPDGSDFLLDVEALRFANGATVSPAELAKGGRTDAQPPGSAYDPVLVEEPRRQLVDGDGRWTADFSGLTRGIVVTAVDDTSPLGRQLAGQGADVAASYTTQTHGATAKFDGVAVDADYYSTQTNRAGEDGALLAETPLDAALRFGNVVINAAGIRGTDRNDAFIGRWASDFFHGSAGNDVMVGHRGDDVLFGDDGDDYLVGGAGNDLLVGRAGNDLLVGRAGDDQIWSGGGHDRVKFRAGDGNDVVYYFTSDDLLDLRDFFSRGQDLAHAAREVDGTLVISNGTDQITLDGLDLDDMDWVSEVTLLNIPGA